MLVENKIRLAFSILTKFDINFSRMLGDFIAGSLREQAPVVQTLDSAIHWINHYPLDNSIGYASVYPLDSDLSGGQCYPSFEQLGPELQWDVLNSIQEVTVLWVDF